MRRVSVRAIIMDGNRILCVKHKNYASDINELHGDYWCLPGGTIEDGEALESALERELVEELGVAPNIGSLLYIQQFGNNEKEHLEFFFHVQNDGQYNDINLASTTHGSIEIQSIDFVDPKTTNILPAFLTTEVISASSQPKIFSFF